MFGLVIDYLPGETSTVEWYDTKEDLLEHYSEYLEEDKESNEEDDFCYHFIVEYSLEEINSLF